MNVFKECECEWKHILTYIEIESDGRVNKNDYGDRHHHYDHDLNQCLCSLTYQYKVSYYYNHEINKTYTYLELVFLISSKYL